MLLPKCIHYFVASSIQPRISVEIPKTVKYTLCLQYLRFPDVLNSGFHSYEQRPSFSASENNGDGCVAHVRHSSTTILDVNAAPRLTYNPTVSPDISRSARQVRILISKTRISVAFRFLISMQPLHGDAIHSGGWQMSLCLHAAPQRSCSRMRRRRQD